MILRKYMWNTSGNLVTVSERCTTVTWCQRQTLVRSHCSFLLLFQGVIFRIQWFNHRCHLRRSHITNFRKHLKPTWSEQSHPETSMVSLTHLHNHMASQTSHLRYYSDKWRRAKPLKLFSPLWVNVFKFTYTSCALWCFPLLSPPTPAYL